MCGKYIPHNPERVVPCSIAANKISPPESKENDSDKDSGHNTVWQKTKEVCENVKDGITKPVESTIESVKAWVKPGKHYADVPADGGVGNGKISLTPENDGTTKTWDDIKNRADTTLEASKEYPGVHMVTKNDPGIQLGTNKGIDTGLLEPQHTLYNSFGDGANLEHSKQFSGVDNIPESVNKDAATLKNIEQKFEISDDDLIGTGSDNEKFVFKRGHSFCDDNNPEFVNRDATTPMDIENKFEISDDDLVGTGPDNEKFVFKRGLSLTNETSPHVYEAIHDSGAMLGGSHLLGEVADNELNAAVMNENLDGTTIKLTKFRLIYFPYLSISGQNNGKLEAIVGDLRYMAV